MEKIPIHLNPDFPYTGVSTEANTVRIYKKLYSSSINYQRISVEIRYTMMAETI